VAQSRDFNSISDALFDAQRRGDLDGYWEAFRSLTNRLDDMVAAIQGIKDGAQTKGSGGASNSTAQIAPGGSSASRVSTIPRAISNNMALKKRSAIKVTANAATTASDQQITGVVDPMTGYTLQSGRDVDSEVIINAAINHQNGAIRLATAADTSLPCSGIVQAVGDFSNQFMFRDGGLCYALIKTPIQSYANRVYLSVTPGFLTTDPAEPGKVYNQEVGRFRKLITPQLWQDQDGSAIAEISFQYSPYS
jgi:hypothetical protein